MNTKLKKVNKKILEVTSEKMEQIKEVFEMDDMENRKKLFRVIKANPGATLNELFDNYTGLDVYSFFQDMILLFDETDIVSDCEYVFPDEETRQEMAEERLY